MTSLATGTFEVKLKPLAPIDEAGEATLGALSIRKRFHGALEATSKGQMLAVGTAFKGSAGYVAMERVTGSLEGRNGSFALQHSGTANRGAQQLSVTVVPDSGTGELAGLTGSLKIIIDDDTHSYEFSYALPDEN